MEANNGNSFGDSADAAAGGTAGRHHHHHHHHHHAPFAGAGNPYNPTAAAAAAAAAFQPHYAQPSAYGHFNPYAPTAFAPPQATFDHRAAGSGSSPSGGAGGATFSATARIFFRAPSDGVGGGAGAAAAAAGSRYYPQQPNGASNYHLQLPSGGSGTDTSFGDSNLGFGQTGYDPASFVSGSSASSSTSQKDSSGGNSDNGENTAGNTAESSSSSSQQGASASTSSSSSTSSLAHQLKQSAQAQAAAVVAAYQQQQEAQANNKSPVPPPTTNDMVLDAFSSFRGSHDPFACIGGSASFANAFGNANAATDAAHNPNSLAALDGVDAILGIKLVAGSSGNGGGGFPGGAGGLGGGGATSGAGGGLGLGGAFDDAVSDFGLLGQHFGASTAGTPTPQQGGTTGSTVSVLSAAQPDVDPLLCLGGFGAPETTAPGGASAVPQTALSSQAKDDEDDEDEDDEGAAPAAPITAPASASAATAGSQDCLANFSMRVPGLSLEPMTAKEILRCVEVRTDEVVTRYLPCVEFLVACQQELRAGLANATKKKMVGRTYKENMTPKQFYNQYLAHLATRFFRQNEPIMPRLQLKESFNEIKSLCADAKRAEKQGCEAVKNAFLGGMRDGESWGLRRWLSKNGGGLQICNDLELIHQAVQKLERGTDPPRRLSEISRPRAEQALRRLRDDVPSAYQEVSTAHPYLPFFHRIESALKCLSTFDPDDDDVVEIMDDSDDDDDIVVEEKDPPPKRKRAIEEATSKPTKAPKKKKTKVAKEGSSSFSKSADDDGDEDESDIEVVCVKHTEGEDGDEDGFDDDYHGDQKTRAQQESGEASADFKSRNGGNESNKASGNTWRCSRCTMMNTSTNGKCSMCDDDEDDGNETGVATGEGDLGGLSMDDFGSGSDQDFGVADGLSGHGGRSPLSSAYAAMGKPAGNSIAEAKQTINLKLDPASLTPEDACHLMVKKLDTIARVFDAGDNGSVRPDGVEANEFWNQNGNYAYLLRTFRDMVQKPESRGFLLDAHSSEEQFKSMADYASIIKHPLCFGDIVTALRSKDADQGENSDNDSDDDAGGGKRRKKSKKKKRGRKQLQIGELSVTTLKQWNMWRGRDLIQAIDLVLLNALAYDSRAAAELEIPSSKRRLTVNAMRKNLWECVRKRSNGAREHVPTKRGETSGFVVKKAKLDGK